MAYLAPSAPLTDEDQGIWLRVQLLARVVPLQSYARAADYRDANLIYRYEASKAAFVLRWGVPEYQRQRAETVAMLARLTDQSNS